VTLPYFKEIGAYRDEETEDPENNLSYVTELGKKKTEHTPRKQICIEKVNIRKWFP